MTHSVKNKLLAALLFAALLIMALPITLLAAEAPEPGGEGEPAQTAPANEEPDAPTASTPALVQPNPKYPEIVPIEMDVESISANTFHAMALDAGGNVYTWGRNTHGATGDGTAGNPTFPITPIELPGRAVQVAAGQEVSLALLEDGSVYDWGAQSAMAYLGDSRNGTPAQYIPAKVPTVPAIQSIAANKGAFAIAADGAVWSWGPGGNIARTGGSLAHERSPAKTNLTGASALFDLKFVGYAPTQSGVYGWGQSITGLKQIIGTSLLTRSVSKTNISDVRCISGTGRTLFIVNNAGRLQVWGNQSTNNYGILGLGHTNEADKKLTTVFESGIVKVQAPESTSFILKEDGTVWSAGRNLNGALGLGEEDVNHFVTEFTQIEALENVVDIVSTSTTTYAKTADGCWWAWGDASRGQLPSGCVAYQTVDSPVLIFAPAGYTPVDPEPGTHTITLTETWADGAQPDVVNTYEVEDARPFSALFTRPAGYTAEVACAENLSINYEAMRVYLYSVKNSFDILVTYTPETLSGYTPETQKEEQP